MNELPAGTITYPWTRLWSQDFKESVYDSETASVTVEEFMGGYDWLHMVIDYSESWKTRWSGRIEWDDGVLKQHAAGEYLEHLLSWPTPGSLLRLSGVT